MQDSLVCSTCLYVQLNKYTWIEIYIVLLFKITSYRSYSMDISGYLPSWSLQCIYSTCTCSFTFTQAKLKSTDTVILLITVRKFPHNLKLKVKLYFDRIIIRVELVQIETHLGKLSKSTWQIHSSCSKIALHLLVNGKRNQGTHGKTGHFSPLEEFACGAGCLVWPTRDNEIQNTYENSSCKLSHTMCSCVYHESSCPSYTKE